MRWLTLVVSACVCLALASTTSAQPTSAAAAEKPPRLTKGWLTYAQSLVRLERTVGVVLREHEMHGTVVTDTTARRETTVTESRRGDVTRLLSDGAVRCRAALGRPTVPLVLRGRPVAVLQDLLMQDATSSTRMPPGLVGGASPSARSAARTTQELEVHVEDGDTIERALDRLVSAGLPFGWGLIERDDARGTSCQVVLFTEDTVLATSYDALSLPAPPADAPR